MAASSRVVALLVLVVALASHVYANYGHGGNFPCRSTPGKCQWVSIKCPPGCPNKCSYNCRTCTSNCGCNRKGSACQDPRFVGADGVTFYFHGQRHKTFCLVSDNDLHINALFIGKERDGGKSRDFTWVKSLGIMFGSHKLYLGANRVAKWDDDVDQLAIVFDSTPVTLNLATGSSWEAPEAGLQVVRNKATNAISIEVDGLFSIEATVVPITAQESSIHNYGITEEDCFAHLDLHFKFFKLSPHVNGVLGHTYAPGFVSTIKRDTPMPIMGGNDLYATSSLFATDCQVSQFGLSFIDSYQEIKNSFPSVECGSEGSGMVCRR